MGNLLKGVSSESEKVVAIWPERNKSPEAQSLNLSPVLSRGPCRPGMANAPSAITGVSFSSSRRLMLMNLFLSMRVVIRVAPGAQRPFECDSPAFGRLQLLALNLFKNRRCVLVVSLMQ